MTLPVRVAASAALLAVVALVGCEPSDSTAPIPDTSRLSAPPSVDVSVAVPHVDGGEVMQARVTGELACSGEALRVTLTSDVPLEAELTLRGPNGSVVEGWRSRRVELSERTWSAESWALCAGRIHRYHLVIASV